MIHEEIKNIIIDHVKTKKDKWYKEFNKLSREQKNRVLKDLYINYISSVLTSINELDSEIHIQNIGTLNIKPSRKQYLDLLKEGKTIEEAVQIVKDSYREINGKKKNIL